MVTLKNNFGVEPDKDNVGMNVSEGSGNDGKSSVSGHPKAILMCRKNSHPFQARTLILNTPAKIGRSVARARPSSYNGIFDCKVLSRNHAIIWYEYDSGKFMIQDTKSSNGTFVNNQRLSKGGETSLPREFFSRDVVQFGVDVLENQRKGNEESDNSDESNHIVTHGCIVATVRLVHPNGKESKSGQSFSVPNSMTQIQMTTNQEKICKLELIIYEAQQREGRLHDKLEELQLIIGKLEVACQETLTDRFEETRLLSKIANLEKQTKIMNRVMAGATGKSSEKVEGEIQQLLADIEKVQSVAREIQEKQHRKLLESEQKLLEAQRVASNLELEVIALREQASLTQLQLQEMGTRCTEYCESIDILKLHCQAQKDVIQKLEGWMMKIEECDGDRDLKTHISEFNNFDDHKLIADEDSEGNKKDKENQEIVLECYKVYEDFEKIEEKEFNNVEDKSEWLTKKFDSTMDSIGIGLEQISKCIGLLESTLTDVEKSKKKLEKLFVRSHALCLELNAAKIPVEVAKKTDNDFEGELFKPLILPSVSNEKITRLEGELEENEGLLNKARFKQRELQGKYTVLKRELLTQIRHCAEFISKSYKLNALLSKYVKSIEENSNEYKQKNIKLETEIEELKSGGNQKINVVENLSKNVEPKGTQTAPVLLISSSTNTEEQDTKDSKDSENLVCEKLNNTCIVNAESRLPEVNYRKSPEIPDKSTTDNSSAENLVLQAKEELSSKSNEPISDNLGVWEKIQKIQGLLCNKMKNEVPFQVNEINEMKNLINLLAEDVVLLLLREQKISKDNQGLHEKLNKSLSERISPPVELTVHLRTLMIFCVTAVAAYFVYIIFL